MKRRLKLAALFALGLCLLLTLTGVFLPSRVVVERSVRIEAPARVIYPLLASFRDGWTRWNTFDDEDPGIQYRYEGPAEGVGAVQLWKSSKMGDGRMTLVRAEPDREVEFELAMDDGEFRLQGFLTLVPEVSATRLTWRDEFELGANPCRKLLGPVFRVMIGAEFEKSLAAVKRIAESNAPPPARGG